MLKKYVLSALILCLFATSVQAGLSRTIPIGRLSLDDLIIPDYIDWEGKDLNVSWLRTHNLTVYYETIIYNTTIADEVQTQELKVENISAWNDKIHIKSPLNITGADSYENKLMITDNGTVYTGIGSYDIGGGVGITANMVFSEPNTYFMLNDKNRSYPTAQIGFLGSNLTNVSNIQLALVYWGSGGIAGGYSYGLLQGIYGDALYLHNYNGERIRYIAGGGADGKSHNFYGGLDTQYYDIEMNLIAGDGAGSTETAFYFYGDYGSNSVLQTDQPLSLRTSGDGDDYIQFYTIDDIPRVAVTGETYGRWYQESDVSNIQFRLSEDDDEYGYISWLKDDNIFRLLSKNTIEFLMDSDVDDYIEFNVSDDMPRIRSVGSNLMISPDEGRVNFNNSNLTVVDDVELNTINEYLQIYIDTIRLNESEWSEWVNASYLYRTNIIMDTTTSDTSGWVVHDWDTETLILDEKMTTNCTDIMVLNDSDDLQEFFVKDCDTATSQLWVHTGDYTAGPWNFTVYYGNNTLPTFLQHYAYFYDSFENYTTGAQEPDDWDYHLIDDAWGTEISQVSTDRAYGGDKSYYQYMYARNTIGDLRGGSQRLEQNVTVESGEDSLNGTGWVNVDSCTGNGAYGQWLGVVVNFNQGSTEVSRGCYTFCTRNGAVGPACDQSWSLYDDLEDQWLYWNRNLTEDFDTIGLGTWSNIDSVSVWLLTSAGDGTQQYQWGQSVGYFDDFMVISDHNASDSEDITSYNEESLIQVNSTILNATSGSMVLGSETNYILPLNNQTSLGEAAQYWDEIHARDFITHTPNDWTDIDTLSLIKDANSKGIDGKFSTDNLPKELKDELSKSEGLDLGELVSVLWATNKRLIEKVETLEARVAILEKG